MALDEKLFFEEFLAPIYKQYADDPRFIIRGKDNTSLYDIQYALAKESVLGEIFTPITWKNDEDEDRQLIIGFSLSTHPEYILLDAQYAKGDAKGMIDHFLFESFLEYGEQRITRNILAYVGFADVYIQGGN